jgi:hypothetical protein
MGVCLSGLARKSAAVSDRKTMTTDDLWRVALIAAGDDALILFFQALRKPPKKTVIARPPVWAIKLWVRIAGRRNS